jgi:protein TonB
MKVKAIFRLVVFSLALNLSLGLFAQQNEPIHSSVDDYALAPMDKQEVSNFIYANLTYPQQEIGSGIEGKVIVKFVVEKDGTISNMTIDQSLSTLIDQEAQRVISLLPIEDNIANAVKITESITPMIMSENPVSIEE